MLIRIGYNIALRLASPTAVLYVLHVHPSRKGDLVRPEDFRIEPALPVEDYFDSFGNHCCRVNAPAGVIRFLNDAFIRDHWRTRRLRTRGAAARCSPDASGNAVVCPAEPLLRSR